MTKLMKITTAGAIGQADTHAALYNVGGAGKLQIYGGTRPANPEDAAGSTVLCEITLQNPAFGAAADVSGDGQIALNGTPLQGTATAAGTATWCRFLDGAGTAVQDANVGTGDFDLSLDNLVFQVGTTVTVQSWTITARKAQQ